MDDFSTFRDTDTVEIKRIWQPHFKFDFIFSTGTDDVLVQSFVINFFDDFEIRNDLQAPFNNITFFHIVEFFVIIIVILVILVDITFVLEVISMFSTSCFDRPPPILILDHGGVATLLPSQAKGGRYG